MPNIDKKVNLKQYSNHQKRFPWQLVIRILSGIVMVGFIYYVTDELFKSEQNKSNNKKEDESISVEIEFEKDTLIDVEN